jgi:hypothetical protein
MVSIKISKRKNQKGTITPALLVVASAFIIVIYALLLVLSLQFDYSHRQVASERSLYIAEAGVNYYRWHLSENPDDYQDGTGGAGPYEHEYKDPQGDVIGTYSLEIDPPTDSSPIITITSTGWTTQYPKVKRTIRAQYGQVSLTRYAFLHNSNVRFGNDVTINGPVFSNGGIRQDGTNTSTVQSAKETYICGLESGCTSPTEEPGVWGTGKIEELWEFPVNQIDFDSFKVNFSEMKTSAQNDGLYLDPSGSQGYHIIFTSDGNLTVYEVTGVSPIKGYSLENGCDNLYQTITDETIIGTYAVDATPIIFAEDNVWVEGVVNGKTTIAVARFPLGTFNAVIWIPNNLTYLAKDGNNKLGLVVEKDVIITRDVPEYFEINGAFLAQNGRIIRHHYGYYGCKSTGADKVKKELRFYGSLISNQQSYWNFPSGPKSPASGFQKSILDYDQTNFYNPPPYFPTSRQFDFLSWQEVKS